MDDSELQKIANELESDAAKQGPRIAIRQYGGGADESCIVGNRAGLVRLAAAVLRAAMLPPDAEQSISTGEIIERESDAYVDFIARSENWDEEKAAPTAGAKFRNAAYGIGCAILVIICVLGGIVVVGALNVWLAAGIIAFLVVVAMIGKILDERRRD